MTSIEDSVSRPADQGAGACPAEVVLLEFSLGKLPGEKFETIYSHVAGCRTCSAALANLSATEDTLDSQLRQFVAERSETEATAGITAAGPAPSLAEWIRSIGNYAFQKEIGRGGMGVVFRAHHKVLKRTVAIKTLDCLRLTAPDAIARFRTEAEAIGRLKHAHIVQVHEYGEHDGRPYLCLEYVSGPTLAQRLSMGPLPEREAAQLAAAIGRAIHFAHQQRVVHRDVKPSNVLLGPDGIKLSDFGLAKLVDADDGHTTTGAVLGTACYMAPEQARGDARKLGPLTDVYGIGAVLYEALTGAPPFRGATRAETLRAVQFSAPRRPRSINGRISRSLEAICLKCLEKAPADRYPSAEALVDDLDRWLRGERVTACRGILGYLSPKTVRRAALAAAAIVLLAAAALVADHFSPQGRLRSIEGQLSRGDKVTLIGDTGEPAWMRVAAGRSTSRVDSPARGTCTVFATGVCLVELLPAMPCDHFRLSADVQHERAMPNCARVGLIVSLRTTPTAVGVEHAFEELTYNDKEFSNHPANRVRLSSHFYRESGDLPADSNVAESDILAFRHAGNAQAPWRRLVVTVHPQWIEATWDGQPAGKLTREEIDVRWDEALVRGAEVPGYAPRLPQFKPGYDARGAVGLYVGYGIANFRNVKIEPLPLPPELGEIE